MANYYKEINRILEKIIYKVLSIDKSGIELEDVHEKLSFLDIHILKKVGDEIEKSMQSLIKEMDFERGIITPIINKMVACGYIIKEKSERDKRVFNLRLTEDGKRVYNKIIENEKELFKFILKDITLNEEKAVLKFLSKINQTTVDKYEKIKD